MFDVVEDLMTRLGWCRSQCNLTDTESSYGSKSIAITTKTSTFDVPFSAFEESVDETLFSVEPSADDDAHALQDVIYSVLLQVPVDVRRACLPRIVVAGGGGNIPGLKSRIAAELERLVARRGWNVVLNHGSVDNGITTPEVATPVVPLSNGHATQKQEEPPFEKIKTKNLTWNHQHMHNGSFLI